MNLAGVEGENGAQAGVFLPYSRHAPGGFGYYGLVVVVVILVVLVLLLVLLGS